MSDISFRVDPEGRRILDALERLPDKGDRLLRIGLESVAIDFRDELKRTIFSGNPLRERTGQLKNAWKYKFKGRKKIIMSPGRATGLYVALDRGATITPKKAEVLRFEVDGKVIFAKSVKLKRRRFLGPFVKRYNSDQRKIRTAEKYIGYKLKAEGLL